MNIKDAPVEEEAIHAAIEAVIAARAYWDSRSDAVSHQLREAFDCLLGALNEARGLKSKTQRITFRLDHETSEQLGSLARQRGCSHTHLILQALAWYLAKARVVT